MNGTNRTNAVLVYWTILDDQDQFVTKPYIGNVLFFLQALVYIRESGTDEIKLLRHTLARVEWIEPSSTSVDFDSGLLSLQRRNYSESHFPFITPRRLICKYALIDISQKRLVVQIPVSL